MLDLPAEVHRVQEIINRYHVIDNEIFKFSLRKVVPIPGLFKPADYEQYQKELDSLVYELEGITIPKGSDPEFVNIFRQYNTALRKTIQFLRNICGHLYDKSQGLSRDYTIRRYESDVDIYKGLAKRYRLLGSVLNEYLVSDKS